DPLDGTKEFINKNGEFTVNIALVQAHRPVLGVVHVPVKDITYSASPETGASKSLEGDVAPIHCKKLAENEPVRVVGSRSHRGSSLDAFLDRLSAFEILAMGSSLKLCLVAEGRADIYPRLGPTSEWDTAAAQCVVEQAGGEVYNVETWRPLEYNRKESILNPHFFVAGDTNTDWKAYFTS
ncbi:MAG: 3'(2'),5'-bisphosphate nucleotidase CysQ, partial [Gammaproteobacteria bacterium]